MGAAASGGCCSTTPAGCSRPVSSRLHTRCPGPACGGSSSSLSTPRRRWFPDQRRLQGDASSGDLLPLQALAADGVGVLESGALVRWIELERPVNPLIHDGDEAEGISRALAGVAARLDAHQSLQLLAHAIPLPTQAILAHERRVSARASERARARGQRELAVALERLALAQQQSIRSQSFALAALQLRYVVVVPWLAATRPATRLRKGGMTAATSAAYQRAMREHTRHCDGVRSDLQAAGLTARELDGQEVASLLWEHLTPTGSEGECLPLPALELPGTLAELDSAGYGTRHATELRRVLCREPVDLRERSTTRVGGEVCQTRYVGSLPEQTWLGWLLHLMSAERPFTLPRHVHGIDRARERLHHRRRADLRQQPRDRAEGPPA